MTHYPPSRPVATNNGVPSLGAVIDFYLEHNHLTNQPRWMHMDTDRMLEIAYYAVHTYTRKGIHTHRANDLIQAIALHRQRTNEANRNKLNRLQKALQ